MKLIIYLFFTALGGFFVFKFLKKIKAGKPIIITSIVVFILITFGLCVSYISALAPDKYCTNPQQRLYPRIAEHAITPEDFFNLGNTYYDRGNCETAIINYTKAVELDPLFAKAYNNRAYTNMRLQNYKDALADLDKAIEINPNYVEALMNRGDIYNYYYSIDRKKAIEDYNRVIALGKEKDRSKSVCGHKAMAETNNLIPLVLLKLLLGYSC